MASIKQNKKTGLYEVRYDAGFDGEGKRIQKYKGGFKRKKDAQDFLADQLSKINHGTYIEPAKMFLFEYLDRWLAEKKPDISPTTYSGYEINIRCHIKPFLGGIRLQELKPAHIRQLYTVLKQDREVKFKDGKKDFKALSNTSVRYVHRVLSKALEDAFMEETIPKNPAKLVKPPSKEKFEAGFLTASQIRQMLNTFRDKEDDMYIPVMLSVLLGLRRGETLGLQWKDINFDEKLVKIRSNYIMVEGEPTLREKTKTDSSRRNIIVTDRIIQELKAHRLYQKKRQAKLGPVYHKNDFVCTWSDGQPFNPTHVSRNFSYRMKKYKMPQIRFHDLRHSNAALMILQNANMKGASDRLGHSTIQITNDLYGHVERSVQEQIAQQIDDAIWGS